MCIILNFTLLVSSCELDLGYSCANPDYDHVEPVTKIPDPCHEFDRDAGSDADAGEDTAEAAGEDGGNDPDGGNDAAEDAATDS